MKKLVLLLTLLFFIIIKTHAPMPFNNDKIQETALTKMKINVIKLLPFSVESFIIYLTLLNVDHKEIMIRQAILETDHFNSNIFKQNYNLFGMNMPKIRTTTAIEERNGFAAYNHWTSSIDDYIILQHQWKILRPEIYQNGYEVIRLASYAENPYYIRLLKLIKICNYDCTSNTESTSI